jgi:hypothetical protein
MIYFQTINKQLGDIMIASLKNGKDFYYPFYKMKPRTLGQKKIKSIIDFLSKTYFIKHYGSTDKSTLCIVYKKYICYYKLINNNYVIYGNDDR